MLKMLVVFTLLLLTGLSDGTDKPVKPDREGLTDRQYKNLMSTYRYDLKQWRRHRDKQAKAAGRQAKIDAGNAKVNRRKERYAAKAESMAAKVHGVADREEERLQTRDEEHRRVIQEIQVLSDRREQCNLGPLLGKLKTSGTSATKDHQLEFFKTKISDDEWDAIPASRRCQHGNSFQSCMASYYNLSTCEELTPTKRARGDHHTAWYKKMKARCKCIVYQLNKHGELLQENWAAAQAGEAAHRVAKRNADVANFMALWDEVGTPNFIGGAPGAVPGSQCFAQDFRECLDTAVPHCCSESTSSSSSPTG